MSVPAAPVPSGAERRVHMRRSLRGDAKVHLTPTQHFVVRMLDVSAGGMAIVANANPRVGTTFTIEFSLPIKGGTTVQTRAQVMHSVLASDERGFKIGLRFVALEYDTAMAIGEFLG